MLKLPMAEKFQHTLNLYNSKPSTHASLDHLD